MSNDESAIDDAQLYAWIDGELDDASAARIAAAVASDPALAARAARQRALRARLQAGFAPILDEPVPGRLLDAIAPPRDAVVDLNRRRVQPARASLRRWGLPEWSAIAATLVLGVWLGAMAFRTSDGLPLDSVDGQLVARGDLDAALSTQRAGTAMDGAMVHIALSFRAADGAYCRAFNLRSGAAGLACRRQGHWMIPLLDGSVPARPASADGYRQAGSALSPAMLQAISALGGNESLTLDQEAEQLRSGWESPTP